jgi:fumarylpyruvate hydrolase
MPLFVLPPPAPTALPVEGGGLFAIRRVFCVGQNYADHAREMGGNPQRDPPFFFCKPADAVTDSAEVAYPSLTQRLDYEGELVVAIGLGGSEIAQDAARQHIFGYAAGCDLTRRDLQAEAKKAGRPWDMAKGFDGSAAVGVIHPASVIGHPTKGAIRLAVNGVDRQNGNLDQMIWSIEEIIASLSRAVRLAAGDLIFTGTPAGVGPLSRGDRVEITVEGLAGHRFTLV